VEDATHPVATVPNALGTIDVTYSSYGDADSYIPESDAHIVCDWSSYGGLASVLVYDDTPDPTSGQIVFYSFDYASAGTGRIDLLENSVTYLLAQESEPTGSISGTVMLVGETDWSGVTVTAYPGGETATTTMSGQYTLSSLYAGTYTVEATKDQWSTAEVTGVSVSEETLTPGIDMMLVPLASSEQCDSPALAIPDNVPSGVTTTLEFTDDMLIDDLEVYVDITHTFIGDLIVEVTSPRGTTVRLHNEGGGSADNLVGWYESELASYETLDACDGEPATGTWTLFVSDNAGYDTGTVNSWCVKVTEEQGATGVDDGVLDAPSRHVLRGASPNPFNPVTEIAYGLPSESEVSIKVYDVTGRLVRVLRDGVEPAGYHSVTWDGRDDRGASVASGVYFCRMQSEEFTGSSKLVLLK
jgi:subtilisin-like proprotein convertase family protein